MYKRQLVVIHSHNTSSGFTSPVLFYSMFHVQEYFLQYYFDVKSFPHNLLHDSNGFCYIASARQRCRTLSVLSVLLYYPQINQKLCCFEQWNLQKPTAKLWSAYSAFVNILDNSYRDESAITVLHRPHRLSGPRTRRFLNTETTKILKEEITVKIFEMQSLM